MADYGRDAYKPAPSRYDYEVREARQEGYDAGYKAGYDAALLALAARATPNSPPRCRACQTYIWEGQVHGCTGTVLIAAS